MSQKDFPKAVERKRSAERTRKMALAKVKQLCDTGQRDRAMPFLIDNMRRHPELGKIRLWQIDAIIFNRNRKTALRWIRKTRELIGDASTIADGYASLAWALESKDQSIRMVTWLYELLIRERICTPDRPDDFPYGALYDNVSEPRHEQPQVADAIK